MSINIEIQNGKTDLVKIFICHGAPASMAGTEETIETLEQISMTQSPIARDLHLLFSDDSGEWLRRVQKVKLAAKPEGGLMTDIVGVELKEGQSWDANLLHQAKGFFEKRITPQTGTNLPQTKIDFKTATDEVIESVFKATLPSEVFRDNPDPNTAVTILDIDRNAAALSFVMSQACAAGACGPFAIQATMGRIQRAMDSNFGIQAKRDFV